MVDYSLGQPIRTRVEASKPYLNVNIDAELGSYTGSSLDLKNFGRKTVYVDLSSLGSAKYWIEASPDDSTWYVLGSIDEIVADASKVHDFEEQTPYLRVRLEMETGSCTATITARGI